MSVTIAEYLGKRTDVNTPVITPIRKQRNIPCHFMNAPCDKISRGDKPICSVRKNGKTLWIVCRHRLCATTKNIPLSDYQKNILLSVAKKVFGSSIQPENVLIKREAPMHVSGRSTYKADFVMVDNSSNPSHMGPRKAVLEMQGGGETSATGNITRHVEAWARSRNRSNQQLSRLISGVGTIETNAWRRQQEQFLIKGRIAMQTGSGCGIIFCVGTLLYDYLLSRTNTASLRDLRQHNWTLALLSFKEKAPISAQAAGPIDLVLDDTRALFTDYQAFVRVIADVGNPSPDTFSGAFETLAGRTVNL
ncbi:MAG: hypothetical protein A3K83_00140 [Omnitrophica WOR_2 bacterium RBG_13_44_8b]|nr:MAG: hypothetical protein A3K83_00140 [Omnitrophica WOR_2 bacterium RBG_13_44_8b]